MNTAMGIEAWLAPKKNSGVASSCPMAGPQTNQRRSNFAPQSTPKPPSARPEAMATPLIRPSSRPASAGPTWKAVCR